MSAIASTSSGVPIQQSKSTLTSTTTPYELDLVEDAVSAIEAGEFVVVVDDMDRENEGDCKCCVPRLLLVTCL